jgi:aminodeoxyfutalosine deaminase
MPDSAAGFVSGKKGGAVRRPRPTGDIILRSRPTDDVLRRPRPNGSGLLLRARLILPISRPPIPNGAVVLHAQKIVAVGTWKDVSRLPHRKVIDFGETILMPGLVNAHCHLDYTNMSGLLLPPKRFTDWLQAIVSVKAHWTPADYRDSWREGAAMLLRNGATTIADIEAVPDLLPDMWRDTPLRVISFLEMIGLSGRRPPEQIVDEAVERIARLTHKTCRAGLSPHAPYSTTPGLLRLSARAARRHRWLLCMHVAESAQEFEMFARGGGAMLEWLKRSGRDVSDCGSVSPVQHLARCGALGKNLLAIHANYLRRGDARLLAANRVSVVHCPRSHHYFGHGPFPLNKLLRAGVNICLGTDSLATVFKRRREKIELSMFDEMRQFAANPRAPAARKIVEMSTRNGALALGMKGQIGELKESAFADLIAVPFKGKVSQAHEAIIQHAGPVSASMIGARWAVKPADLR